MAKGGLELSEKEAKVSVDFLDAVKELRGLCERFNEANGIIKSKQVARKMDTVCETILQMTDELDDDEEEWDEGEPEDDEEESEEDDDSDNDYVDDEEE